MNFLIKLPFYNWICCSGDGGVSTNTQTFKKWADGNKFGSLWDRGTLCLVTELDLLYTQGYKKIHPRD